MKQVYDAFLYTLVDSVHFLRYRCHSAYICILPTNPSRISNKYLEWSTLPKDSTILVSVRETNNPKGDKQTTSLKNIYHEESIVTQFPSQNIAMLLNYSLSNPHGKEVTPATPTLRSDPTTRFVPHPAMVHRSKCRNLIGIWQALIPAVDHAFTRRTPTNLLRRSSMILDIGASGNWLTSQSLV